MRISVVLLLACAMLVSPAHAGGHRSVVIVSPQPETTIHDNSGNMEVVVSVAPTLNGYAVTILVDDIAVASGAGRHFRLEGIDRGTHTLTAQVHAADGKVLAVSEPVTFYMWRASRLFRNRQH